MADIADQAQKLEQQARDIALARHKMPVKVSQTHCQHFQEAIPLLRQKTIIGVCFCVHCQQQLEAKNRHYLR